MEHSLQYNYSQSLDSLEDLKLLIAPDLGHFIDQAIFHIVELKSRVERETGKDLQEFATLRSLLELRIEEILKRALKKSPLIVCCTLGWRPSGLRLESWNTIIESVDHLLELLAVFNFKKSLNIVIDEGMIELTGFISLEKWEDNFRTKAYKTTRTLLEKKSILTYRLLEKDDKNNYRIKLRLDFSHNENSVYCVDLRENHDLMICFSNVFNNYKIGHEELLELEDHHCIEITDALEMKRHKNVPVLGETGHIKNVLHFPFLFRPISLIIPRGGEIISMEELSSSVKFQDEKKLQTGLRTNPLSDNKRIYFLDFFSFFSDKNPVAEYSLHHKNG